MHFIKVARVIVSASFLLIFTYVNAYQETITYQYDDLNRLESATSGAGASQTYVYDEKHNRTSFSTAINAENTPIAVNDFYNVAQDTALTINASGVLSNDYAPLALPISAFGNTAPEHGSLTLNTDGSFTYTPSAGFYGIDHFNYQVSNSNGEGNFAAVIFNVSATNPAPNVTDDLATVNEDISSPELIAVLDNDSDPNGTTLNLVSVSYSGLSTVAVVGNSVSYTPASNFTGTEILSYIVGNAGGATSTGQVTVTVTGDNDPPIAEDDEAWVLNGRSVTIPVLSNDTDVEGDSLTVSQLSYSGPGTATLNDNLITFESNSILAQQITYTVIDGNGGTATATVYINKVFNNAPNAVNDAYIVIEDASLAMGILENDSDANGDQLNIVSHTSPSHGSLSFVGDVALYTPYANYVGNDSFTYTIQDADGLSDSATVSITVSEDLTNDPPIARNDGAGTKIDTATIINVLANDEDLDRDTLYLKSFTNPSPSGTLVRSGQNLRYTPPAGFIGQVTFNYVVEDRNGGEDSGSVSISVYNPGAIIVPILSILLLDEEED